MGKLLPLGHELNVGRVDGTEIRVLWYSRPHADHLPTYVRHERCLKITNFRNILFGGRSAFVRADKQGKKESTCPWKSATHLALQSKVMSALYFGDDLSQFLKPSYIT